MCKQKLQTQTTATVVIVLALAIASCGASRSSHGHASTSNLQLPPVAQGVRTDVSYVNQPIATVEKHIITRGALEHWMAVGARLNQDVPQPPAYSGCIARLRAIAHEVQEGLNATHGQLTRQCQTKYREYTEETLSSLIASAWVIGEARDLGVAPSAEAVATKLAREENALFPTKVAFEQYLAKSGETATDLRYTLQRTLAAEAIRHYIERNRRGITHADVVRYYASHRQRFAAPERRDIEAIRTWTLAAITRARRDIADGASFGAVARRVSIDRPYNAKGGLMRGIVRGQEEKGLDGAIFAAKPGRLVGPLHLRGRYYLFELLKVDRGHQRPLVDVEAEIGRNLPKERSLESLASFIKGWRTRWRSQTSCRPGYIVSKCKQYGGTATSEDPYTLD